MSYPIVDRWYNKGHDHYHKDEGEGMDMYQVGATRGCGGTGIWDGKTLAVARNFKDWKILANGPIRAIFELTFEARDAHGRQVTETKRFTVDAGHQLDRIESTFNIVSGDQTGPLDVAIGLNKTPTDRGQDPEIEVTRERASGLLTQWVVQKTNDSLGTAVIVPADSFETFAEDERNLLAIAKGGAGDAARLFMWARPGRARARSRTGRRGTNTSRPARAGCRVRCG